MPTTADNLRASLKLMKTEGRARFVSYRSQEDVQIDKVQNAYYGLGSHPGEFTVGYCALGAINAIVRGNTKYRAKYGVWDFSPEALALADVILENSDDLDTDGQKVVAVAAFNDETADDEKVFAVFERAIANQEALLSA